jgi:hypothetical protein
MWVYDPHSGGAKIPDSVKLRLKQRILRHAEQYYSGKYNRIEVRFRGQFCYIDAYLEPRVGEAYDPQLVGETREEYLERLRNMPTHLCRLRYFGREDNLSMAFYAYSSETYEPCLFPNGTWEGTVEEGFDASAIYLAG